VQGSDGFTVKEERRALLPSRNLGRETGAGASIQKSLWGKRASRKKKRLLFGERVKIEMWEGKKALHSSFRQMLRDQKGRKKLYARHHGEDGGVQRGET